MSHPPPLRPALLGRSAVAWWWAVGCWFAGSTLGQLAHDPTAVFADYRYAVIRPDTLAVTLFGVVGVFLASVALPMRDGVRWGRGLLTGLAVPLALTLGWQAARTIGQVTPPDVAQGLLCLVALAALGGAVHLMYRPEARTYYRQQGDHAR